MMDRARHLAEATGLALLLLTPAFARQDKEKVTVKFEGVELEALAQQVERVTKKTFLSQEQILKGKKVNLKSDTPISPDEFYRVFQTVCHMHGLALIPVKSDTLDLVKIVQAQQAQKEPGAQPVMVQGDALPAGDTLVYYLLSPKHISATKALAVLATAISSTGTLQQVAGSDIILVIDVATSIRRAEELLSRVDRPSAPVASALVVLEHLKATQAKAQVTDFIQAFDKAATGETGRSRVEVLLDERLNTVHLIGPEEEVKRVQEFLKKADQDVPPAKRTIQYHKLKNVPAADVADTVRQLLGLAVAARATATSPEKLPKPPGATPPEPARTDAPKPAVPAGVEGPATRQEIEVVPLDSLNTLVVIGNPEVHEEVRKILENIDRRKSQILMEVAIIQVTGDDSLDFGIEALAEDVGRRGQLANGGTGFGLGTQADTKGAGFPNVQNLAGFTGGAVRYLVPDDISVLVRAIATKSNVNILSQPLLLVNDNEDADFTTRVSEPTVALSQGTATTTTAFAGFADATTSLKIKPQASPDGYINLKITQNFEEFTGSATATGVPPPKVSNQVTSKVTVPDRHTVILGGFTRDAATDSSSGIPVLRDIPLIGPLFGSTSTRLTKSRLYLFVRPRILSVDGFADLKSASGEKVTDLRRFIRGSRIEGAIKGALAPWGGSPVKEAPLPFAVPEEPKK